MASEGIRFTQCYAGSTVCAPSRCCLMTGLHTGHARIRGNSLVPLRPEDETVADYLKETAHDTALIGKWGLGEAGTTGTPNRKGFGYFFGYLNQVHAHNYYPDYLWRNEKRVRIAGNVVKDGVAVQQSQYSPDLLTKEALSFLEKRRDQPFFLYLAYTIPHANNERGKLEGNGLEVPDDAPYSQEPWPQVEKNYAAMITRLDRDVGRILRRIGELGLDKETIVFFSSDNGPHREGGADPHFFRSAGPLRGHKRDLYEGGIRVPMIARWPNTIRPGTVSDHVCAFWDLYPTVVDLAPAALTPNKLDGISIVPTLTGKGTQKRHEFLYWEFHERGFQQAVRMGDWKAVRRKTGAALELYDLKRDVGEQKDVAAENPDVVRRIEEYLKGARTESPYWPKRS
jgi:arylsulfatase A-like enzyme